MQHNQEPAIDPLYSFAQRWLGRDLSDSERAQLQAFALSTGGAQGKPPPKAREMSRSLIDAERQRVDGLIAHMLHGMQDAARGVELAGGASGQAVLDAVSSAQSLDALRPGRLRQPHSGETSGNQLLVAQIADRLGNLVRSEVQACFEREFGSLAQQMQSVVEAARANGLVGSPPAADAGQQLPVAPPSA
ncbi:hypothetical protein [Xanthomonas theicola]|uniref:Uncharacterized protein n=1 Tax=Xanthomonas theicola TaxID=56464 RepID=A0A2S6ZDI9_9XANT|nr:hypothetical protein [Xanthomonas theicola]PPT90236.1 hypothetical protein XthCFBP4691_13450 [Xanthomonas theicola]QNH25341.1 hypothetical protein G4Q83_12145 [Xanthomonas theicola]